MAVSITACSKPKIELRLEVLSVSSVRDVLREDIVGLVKAREAAPEASDKRLEFPNPVGDTASPSIVFRRRSKGIIESFKWSSVNSLSSDNEQRIFGLIDGDAVVPLSL